VPVGPRFAMLASVPAVFAHVASPCLAQAQPFSAGSPSLQLTVFDRSHASSETRDLFVLSPVVRGEGNETAAGPGPYFPAGDPVVEAMLDRFNSARDDVRPGGLKLQAFSSAPSSGPFVIVPQWMRSGLRPVPFVPALPLAIGSCGIRPYRPSTLLRPTAEARRRAFFPLVQQAACEAGLPVSLMDAMLIQESGYNPWALSSAGAFGLGQLMPGTARYLGVDRYDIRQNLNGAARYLREHLTEFGDARLALAAYNAGPGRVRRSRGVPNITETKDYVRSILKNWSVLENNESTMSWQKH